MKIYASISGYGETGSEPITLAAFKSENMGTLVILQKVPYMTEVPAPTQDEPERAAFVTNMPLANYDCLFTEEHLSEAIKAFKVGEAVGTVVLDEDVTRHRPRIEVDGVDQSGQKYRLHAKMTNGEMAVLALTHFMSRQKAIDSRAGLSDRMARLYEIVSI